MNMIKKIFSFIYLLFSIFLLLAILIGRSKYEIFLALLIVAILYIFNKKNIKIKINDKLINILIIIAIFLSSEKLLKSILSKFFTVLCT